MVAEKLRPDPLVAFYCAEITFPTLSAVNSGARCGYSTKVSQRETHFPMAVINKIQSENTLDRCRVVQR